MYILIANDKWGQPHIIATAKAPRKLNKLKHRHNGQISFVPNPNKGERNDQ